MEWCLSVRDAALARTAATGKLDTAPHAPAPPPVRSKRRHTGASDRGDRGTLDILIGSRDCVIAAGRCGPAGRAPLARTHALSGGSENFAPGLGQDRNNRARTAQAEAGEWPQEPGRSQSRASHGVPCAPAIPRAHERA